MAFLGKTLVVNLDNRQIDSLDADEKAVRPFLGGRGLNVARLLADVPAGAAALGPENVLMLSAGLLTGTEAPASSRL
ncbi:MAG: aldehyde ferredoxin oxidoreductase N-terminal domain-containing protein, partial [Chloroflexota bacterium]